jgi:hypothetical protein
MDKLELQVKPVPPSLTTALRAGFDAIANKVGIILIPISLDVFLWLGPHLQVKTILANYINSLVFSGVTNFQSSDVVTTLVDSINELGSRFNLLSLLRSFPVGIPSLMATRLPVEIPVGVPKMTDIFNPWIVLGVGIFFLFIGLIFGSFFYILVAQVSLHSKINAHQIGKTWLWTVLQVFSLAIALVILFFVISIPSSCIITFSTLFGLPIGQFAVFIYLGIILWLAFPLVFSAHGIFVNHNNALVSVQRSMIMTRMTMPTTALFILCVFGASAALDNLWRVPAENSWLTLIGIGGHAFITSALLAASFIYYRDADLWTQGTLQILKSNRAASIKSV